MIGRLICLNFLPADALGNKFWPGENKVGGECLLVAVCKGGWNADEVENDFFILLDVMVSTEEEKVPHVDEAEEFATAINYKFIVIYLSEIKGWMPNSS